VTLGFDSIYYRGVGPYEVMGEDVMMNPDNGQRLKVKRRVKWIDPKFQRRYILVLLSVTFLISAALFGVFWLHIESILGALSEAGFFEIGVLFSYIEDELLSLLLSVMFIVILFSFLLIYLSLNLSHRIAGPLFALKRSLDRIAEGNLQEARLSFRPTDEFKELAESLNRVVDELEKKA